MNKLLPILIIILFSFLSNIAIAGDDGKLKVNGNKNFNGYEEVGDCFVKKEQKNRIGSQYHKFVLTLLIEIINISIDMIESIEE